MAKFRIIIVREAETQTVVLEKRGLTALETLEILEQIKKHESNFTHNKR